MAYGTIIKDYAKDLYFTVDYQGGHKYSLNEIVDKIQQEFNDVEKYPERSTVARWSQTKDELTGNSWQDLWKSGQKAGYAGVVAERDQRLDQEERIELHLDIIMRERALRAIKLCELPDRELREGKLLGRDAREQISLAETIWNNLNLEDISTADHNDGVRNLVKCIEQSISKQNRK